MELRCSLNQPFPVNLHLLPNPEALWTLSFSAEASSHEHDKWNQWWLNSVSGPSLLSGALGWDWQSWPSIGCPSDGPPSSGDLLVVVLSCSVVSDSLWPHGLWPSRLLYGILQARILEWVAIPFSRGIFPNQGSNQDLLHCRQIL